MLHASVHRVRTFFKVPFAMTLGEQTLSCYIFFRVQFGTLG